MPLLHWYPRYNTFILHKFLILVFLSSLTASINNALLLATQLPGSEVAQVWKGGAPCISSEGPAIPSQIPFLLEMKRRPVTARPTSLMNCRNPATYSDCLRRTGFRTKNTGALSDTKRSSYEDEKGHRSHSGAVLAPILKGATSLKSSNKISNLYGRF
jgi:hypothetical protein